MDLVQIIIIAIVQGITEWIPVSSTGHLILAEKILGYNGGLTFDVALHFGTLMAVFVYFGRDIVDILEEVMKLRFKSENGKLGLLLIVASIPAAIIGFLFLDFFEAVFDNLWVVSLGFGITGVLLLIASLDFGNSTKRKDLNYKNSFLIGIAQAVSILPGISRSGATISSGVLLGLDIEKAMKFSFLMSIPIIFGANILIIGNNRISPELFGATLVAFVVGLITIHLIYRYVLTSRKNLRWFGLYALLLALAVGLALIL